MLKRWNDICLCGEEEQLFPAGAQPVTELFAPLVFLVRRDGMTCRGIWAINSLAELAEEEGVRCLLPCADTETDELADFVHCHGATVANVTFGRVFDLLPRILFPKTDGFRVTLVGLGDVGGTVLTGLKLLGREIDEIAVFDPNEAMCRRYEMELNQVLPEHPGGYMPRVSICSEEQLFNCDVFIFTASRGVPALGSGVKDVRMAQFEANRAMLGVYTRKAREAGFEGLFCQVSDPVDHLSREVFLHSNRDDTGACDFAGLLPEQVQGFGLGVMAARAAYYAEKEGVPFEKGRVYGPHGQGLIVANCPDAGYDDAASCRLTDLTRTANLAVRELGFKPYIAPGLSSAAVSILRLLRGEVHYGAVPLGGAYFGCTSRMTRRGVELQREPVCETLLQRLEETHRALREFDYA
ncbi:MAG: lactate dehydrogenase [Ruminococcaceae bacterium]|nr:lactate dehydrogenase [Oscillospiraceae bacterium]